FRPLHSGRSALPFAAHGSTAATGQAQSSPRQPPPRPESEGSVSAEAFDNAPFMRAMPIFLSKQPPLGQAQPADGQGGGDRNPEQVHPPRGRNGAIEDQRADHGDRPDNEDQESCRPIADVEARIVEPAGTASLRKTDPGAEQRPGSAARALAFDGRGYRRRLSTEHRPTTVRQRAPAAPDVDRREQEQPDDVDEVPVPGGR